MSRRRKNKFLLFIVRFFFISSSHQNKFIKLELYFCKVHIASIFECQKVSIDEKNTRNSFYE